MLVISSTWFADIVETIGLAIFALNKSTILVSGTDSSQSLITVSISLTLVVTGAGAVHVAVTSTALITVSIALALSILGTGEAAVDDIRPVTDWAQGELERHVEGESPLAQTPGVLVQAVLAT